MLHDLRCACRSLLTTPAHTGIVILALSLALGVNVAIFSVTRAVLVRPLPFTAPDRLVALWETHPILGKFEIASADLDDWRADTHSFEDIAAFTMPNQIDLSLSSAGGEPEQVQGTLASGNLFALLGIQPLLGRTLAAGDAEAGHDRVAVIGHALWQRRFGSDPRIVGKAIQLNREPFEIVGVLPARIQAPDWAELWLPMSHLEEGARVARQYHSLQAIARLRPGVSIETADRDLQRVVTRLQRQFPASNKPIGAMIVPLRAEYLGNVPLLLLLLTIAVGLVLFIACVNVAHLSLSRAVTRQREMALRATLGATRARLVRQLLAESLVITAVAGALGLALAAASMDALRAAATDVLPRAADVQLDLATLIAAIVLCAIATTATAIAPAVQSTRPDLLPLIREGDSNSSGAKTRRLHGALVTAEVALTLMVLIGAGLLAASFRRVVAVEPGFATGHLLTARLALIPSRWPTDVAVKQFYQELLARLRAEPGVIDAAMVGTSPLTRSSSRFAVYGLPEPAAGQFPVAQFRTVMPRYHRYRGGARVGDRSGCGYSSSLVVSWSS